MIVGLDHAVIGVHDLDEATKAYRDLGFDVRTGGRHLGRGTHNALIRFGRDYLELMSTFDRGQAATDPFASSLLRFLDGRAGGLIGYVLESDD
ncbi:MAG: VOC family protein, partial [Actinobacteria bacterium]|nr:VOC family protein [Actinomycetota bacterium]